MVHRITNGTGTTERRLALFASSKESLSVIPLSIANIFIVIIIIANIISTAETRRYNSIEWWLRFCGSSTMCMVIDMIVPGIVAHGYPLVVAGWFMFHVDVIHVNIGMLLFAMEDVS